jgi:hypothetical protein
VNKRDLEGVFPMVRNRARPLRRTPAKLSSAEKELATHGRAYRQGVIVDDILLLSYELQGYDARRKPRR